MDQHPQDSAPQESGAKGTTRRTLLGTAIAGTAAVGALGVGVPLAGAGGPKKGGGGVPKGQYRIDLHTHYIPPAYSAFLTSKKVITVPWTVEAQLKFMDTWGIDKSVVSAPQPFDYGNPTETQEVARGINEYGALLMKEQGDRYGIHATLPMPHIEESLAELSYCFDELGFKGGVMLFANYNGVYLGDPSYTPLYEEFNRRGTVVWVHPSFPVEEPVGPYPGQVLEYPFETTRAATLIMYSELLTKYPNIKWQLSHCGGTLPYILSRLAYGQQQHPYYPLVSLPNGPFEEAKKFYYDTAIGNRSEQMGLLDTLTGPGHVIFGTDWPFLNWEFAPNSHEVAPWFAEDLPNSETGDPEPVLSRVWNRPDRLRVERGNALELYPGLA